MGGLFRISVALFSLAAAALTGCSSDTQTSTRENNDGDILLTPADQNAIFGTLGLDVCAMPHVRDYNSLGNTESERNARVWQVVARHLVENKYLDQDNVRGSTPNQTIKDTLAPLAPNQREAVISQLAQELNTTGHGRTLISLFNRQEMEAFGQQCPSRLGSVPHPTISLAATSVDEARLLVIISDVQARVPAENNAAPTEEQLTTALNAMDANARLQLLSSLITPEPFYSVCGLFDASNRPVTRIRIGSGAQDVIVHGQGFHFFNINDGSLPADLAMTIGTGNATLGEEVPTAFVRNPGITFSNPRLSGNSGWIQFNMDVSSSATAGNDQRLLIIVSNIVRGMSADGLFTVFAGGNRGDGQSSGLDFGPPIM